MAIAEEHPHVDAVLAELLVGESSGEEFSGFTKEDFGSEPEGKPSFYPVDFSDQWQEVNYLESDEAPEWLPVFTRASGPHGDIPIDGSPVNIIRLFLTDELLDVVVQETNRYAEEAPQHPLQRNLRYHYWQETSRVEMAVFLALKLAMGITVQPLVADHWRTNWLFETPGFAKVMSRC